jgi:hypothetical protein
MFARDRTHVPQLVLLSEGAGLDDSAVNACRAAQADGFEVLAIPWRSITWQADGAAALAGLAFVMSEVPHVLTRPIRLAPELIAALDWLEPQGLRAATMLAGFYPDAVLGCSEHQPVIAEGEPPLSGLVALAPLAARSLAGNECATARLRAIGQALSLVPTTSDRSTVADPTRLVLPVKGRAFGFRPAIGAELDADLFAAWRELARERIAPPPPILLPQPDILASHLTRSTLKEIALDDSLPLHPLAALLPCPADGPVTVATKVEADARFEYLARDLEGPAITGYPGKREGLLRWLGRTIDPKAADPIGVRLVEPGVGRSVLVDHLSVRNRPHLVDFSALGVGTTPFAVGGYANVGRLIDGKAGLKRGWHRRKCAARLEEAGCRAGEVVALIALPNNVINVPHASDIPAGIVVRGFRCVLRVKQLDPIAHFLHSHRYTPAAHALMLHPFWDAPGARREADPLTAWQQQQTLAGLHAYAQAASLGQLVIHALTPPADPGLGEARRRRLALVRLYAPSLLKLARNRLARELGRELDNRAYTMWFARSLGGQLAIFRRLFFLHDYHHPGVTRTTPDTLHSLSENNISLLAEFPDLETGIFVNTFDKEQADTLFLTQADCDVLKEHYEEFHAVEVSRARAVVLTLAFVALDGDPAGITAALQHFEAAYERKL